MSIVFDARCVGPELSGIGRYALGLLSGLAELSPQGPIYVLGGEPALLREAVDKRTGLELLACCWPPWSLRGQLFLPRLLRKLRCRVFHCPYVFAPFRAPGIAKIVTVHDLIPHRCPQMLAKAWKVRLRWLWNAWLGAQCRGASAIVTVSDFSKRELVEFLGLPPGKVHRIYNGVRSIGTRVTEDQLRERFNLRGPLVSYLGRQDPYKNIEGLIRAFARLCETVPRAVRLVIGGKPDPRYPEARRLAAALGLADRVVFTGYLDDESRVALIRASSVFVFPSRYEGFGLPPLEAMAEGVPVVASDATSLPEVLGDAAILVSPDDASAMAEAIAAVLNDPALAARLGQAGRRRAALFTWSACASEHLRLYETLAR